MKHFNATSAINESPTTNSISAAYMQLYQVYNVLFIALGLSANLLVLLAVKVTKKLHTNFGSMYICSLALSDLCVVVLSDGFTLFGIATDGEGFLNNPSLCIWTSYFCLSACFCSFWSIAGSSLHSYFHVCHRLFYLRNVKAWQIAISVGCIWIGSALLLLPSIFGWGRHAYEPLLMYCIFDYTYYAPYTLFLVVSGAFMPLFLTAVSYAGIALTVIRSRNKLKQQLRHHGSTFALFKSKPIMKPRDIRMMRSMISIAIYVGVTWIYLVVIWSFGGQKTWSNADTVVAMLLAHSHCGMNAVLYLATNRLIREGVKNVFIKTKDEGSNQNGLANNKLTREGFINVFTKTKDEGSNQNVRGNSKVCNENRR